MATLLAIDICKFGRELQHLYSHGVHDVGNLVDMGKLAFAPATPEVLRLAGHLDSSHELFGEVFRGVFRCFP
jgi:hypothetical protein